MGYLSQISVGSFVADGSPFVLPFAGDPQLVRLYYQGNASGNVWENSGDSAIKEVVWAKAMAEGTALATINTNALATDEKLFVTAGGVSLFQPAFGELGPAVTITSVSQANPAVVTAVAHGYATGDVVLLTGIAGMGQINTLQFQITVTGANTFQLNGLNSSGFAAAGSGGVVRRVLYPRAWEPVALTPIAITQAAQAVVTTSIDHGYQVGQMVQLSVPSDFGMVQADGAIADVVAVSANTMTLDLNSAAFTAFAFPASGSPLGMPSLTNYGTRGSLVLNAYRMNQQAGVFLGAQVCGTSGALVHYEIVQADLYSA